MYYLMGLTCLAARAIVRSDRNQVDAWFGGTLETDGSTFRHMGPLQLATRVFFQTALVGHVLDVTFMRRETLFSTNFRFFSFPASLGIFFLCFFVFCVSTKYDPQTLDALLHMYLF